MLTDKKRIIMKLHYLIVVIMMIYITFESQINVNAAVLRESNVPVTYTKSETISYVLTLEVKGEGSVFDGERNIENLNEKYLLKIDDSIKFKFNPKKGAKISQVILNGEDVRENIANNEIVINGTEKEQSLIVEFTSNINGMPQTGDSNKFVIYFLVLLISAVGFILLNRKSKYKN